MKLLAPVMQILSAVREFVAPRYRPELHYMRGPGPAFARRMAEQKLSVDRYASIASLTLRLRPKGRPPTFPRKFR